MAKKYNRTISTDVLVGADDAAAFEYNNASGGRKTIPVGPVYLPIPISSGFTCDATTAVGVPYIGKNLAVYNNADTVGSITLGTTSAVTVLAPGVVNSAGQAGIPCAPNAWTYISVGTQQFVIASDSTLLVYLIDDHTHLNFA